MSDSSNRAGRTASEVRRRTSLLREPFRAPTGRARAFASNRTARVSGTRTKHRAELTTPELETFRHPLVVKPFVRVALLGCEQFVIRSTADFTPHRRELAGCDDVRGLLRHANGHVSHVLHCPVEEGPR